MFFLCNLSYVLPQNKFYVFFFYYRSVIIVRHLYPWWNVEKKTEMFNFNTVPGVKQYVHGCHSNSMFMVAIVKWFFVKVMFLLLVLLFSCIKRFPPKMSCCYGTDHSAYKSYKLFMPLGKQIIIEFKSPWERLRTFAAFCFSGNASRAT